MSYLPRSERFLSYGIVHTNMKKTSFGEWLFLEAKTYDVVTETNRKDAVILLTQGIEPSFKAKRPMGDGWEYSPGAGIDREGLYVAYPGYATGYGDVRLYLTLNRNQVKVSPELEQRGYSNDDKSIEFALTSSDGAVTTGRIPKNVFTKVEVYNRQTFESDVMTPQEFLQGEDAGDEIPQLPTMDEYEQWLKAHADELNLQPRHIDSTLRDYERSGLQGKLDHAREMWGYKK